jgi:hypothetical protein
LKQQKPWFDEECLGVTDQRKQAKMHLLQHPSQRNVDNLNNVNMKLADISRTKRKKYLFAKIQELETNSKIKNIRDLCRQWRTHEFCSGGGGGSTNSAEYRGKEKGDLGAVAP